jgi:hypothetical protein
MTEDLRRKIDTVKRILEQDPDSYMMARLSEGAPPNKSELAGLPTDLRRILEMTDGVYAGNLAVFSSEGIAGNQFYCADLDGGTDRWLCFAVVMDFPLMIERPTGAVWWFPETGLEYYFMSERFELLTESVEEFFDRYVLGEGYARICGTDDPWYNFLRDHDLGP